MAQKYETVLIDQPYTYSLDRERRRTLPSGWRGEVPLKIAREIEKARFGRIVPATASAADGGDDGPAA